ncbi:MLO protein [Salix suchowensis]|nr:MLO protein [Salix suchowensis]
MAEGGTTLEYTPTWVVAAVCSVIVLISLIVERTLHYLGKLLKRKHQKPLFEALQKIKEELMLLGFISLLLTVLQGRINKIAFLKHCQKKCCPARMKPKKPPPLPIFRLSSPSFPVGFPGKVPMLSTTALHHLHIFIFVLACVHVVFCALTILFGSAQIRQWKHWEDSISKKEQDPEQAYNVQDHDFIRSRYLGFGKNSYILGWVHSFFKQFYASVTRSDYTTLRLGFIMTHCRGNRKFNFHKYMMRALEADFKKVVGIRFVFSHSNLNLCNVNCWHAYFWIAFVPFILLLAVGTKLEHVIIQLAHEVAEKHVAVQGDLVVRPSDDHFWFNKPKIVLILIHIILFQNSFELAFFFWIWVQYGFDSCIMGQVGYIIPRLVIGAFVQFLCSYSTLPLYAIVTQMGSSFNRAIFEEYIQEGLVGWAKQAKKKTVLRKAANESSHNQANPREESPLIQMAKAGSKETVMGENKSGEIAHGTSLKELHELPTLEATQESMYLPPL